MIHYFGSDRRAGAGILYPIRGSLRETSPRRSRLGEELIQGILDAQALGVQISHRGFLTARWTWASLR